MISAVDCASTIIASLAPMWIARKSHNDHFRKSGSQVHPQGSSGDKRGDGWPLRSNDDEMPATNEALRQFRHASSPVNGDNAKSA